MPYNKGVSTWWKVAFWGVAVAALGILYFIVDPEKTSWMPQCPVFSLTGLQCPGCGSQRFLHAILHGDLAGAWHANAFLLLALPGIGFLLWLEMTRQRHARLYARVYSTPVIIAIGVALVAWGIGRNIL